MIVRFLCVCDNDPFILFLFLLVFFYFFLSFFVVNKISQEASTYILRKS